MKNRRKTQTEGEEVEIGKRNKMLRIKTKDVKTKRHPAQTQVGCFRTFVFLHLRWVKSSRSFEKKTRLPLNNF